MPRDPMYCTPLARSSAPRRSLSRGRTAVLNLGLATGIAGAVALGSASTAAKAPRSQPPLALSASATGGHLVAPRQGLDSRSRLAPRGTATLLAGAARQAAEVAAARTARARHVAADLRASRSRRAALLASSPQDIARALLADRGESGQFDCLDQLWTRESEWQVQNTNPSSGAYGIPQSLPASKMASAGDDWRTNPETQIRWGLGYIDGRYGSPCAAWSHSQSYNWY